MKRLWSFLCTAVGTILVGSFILMFIIPPLRIIPALILVENDVPSQGGDGIVLLMGDAVDRASHAAQLLESGYGKYIVFVEVETDALMKAGVKPLEGQLVHDYLTKTLNVSKDKILFDRETRVSSTVEEAKAILKVLKRNKLNRNMLATSWYHSSRSAWIFRKVFKEALVEGIKLESYPSPTPGKWYEREKDFLNVFAEYLKWAYYYMRYDLLA